MSFSRFERRQYMRQIKRRRIANAPTMQHAHALIAKVAKEFACEFYEAAAHNNAFYDYYPDLVTFKDLEWHLFIPKAREVLAQMLGMNYPESYKEQIYSALQLDRTLPRPDNVYH